MYDEHDLIHSPLQQNYTVGTHTVEIYIYRMPHTAWTLEVIDEHGNSTVWDDEFGTDQAALDEVMRTIRDDGIESLIGEPSQAAGSSGIESSPLRLATPLSGTPDSSSSVSTPLAMRHYGPTRCAFTR